MNRMIAFCVCAALSVGLYAQIAEAPAGPKHPSMPPRLDNVRGQMQTRPYDKSMEETIQAKVLQVKELPRGPRTFAALLLDVGGEEVQLMIGPTAYVKEKGMSFSEGDQITIKGIRIRRQVRPQGAPRDRAVPPETGRTEAPPNPGKNEPGSGKPADASAGAKDGQPPAVRDLRGGLETGNRETSEPREVEGGNNRAIRIRAREVTLGAKTLAILDDDGRYIWDARRRPAEEAKSDAAAMAESAKKDKANVDAAADKNKASKTKTGKTTAGKTKTGKTK